MMSMWSQSAPQSSIRWASDAKLAKSDDNIDGAIFAATPILILWPDLEARNGITGSDSGEELFSNFLWVTRVVSQLGGGIVYKTGPLVNPAQSSSYYFHQIIEFWPD